MQVILNIKSIYRIQYRVCSVGVMLLVPSACDDAEVTDDNSGTLPRC
jgi:hypothetical protein